MKATCRTKMKPENLNLCKDMAPNFFSVKENIK